MNTYFKDIFEYHHNVNQEIIQELIDLKIVIPENVILLMSHSLNAHQVWNARILGEKEVGVFDIHLLKDCPRMDKTNYNNTLKLLDKFDLNTTIYYSSTSGEKYQNSIVEILTQISQHFSYHRAQIISKLIEKETVLKPTDYIYWKRKKINS